MDTSPRRTYVPRLFAQQPDHPACETAPDGSLSLRRREARPDVVAKCPHGAGTPCRIDRSDRIRQLDGVAGTSGDRLEVFHDDALLRPDGTRYLVRMLLDEVSDLVPNLLPESQ